MKKRIFSLFTSLIMVISLVGVLPMMTAGAETSGDYEYEILDDGTVEITGYNGNGTNLTIPSTLGGKKVTSIGNYAFNACSSLTSITIPDSVTSIGNRVFSGCSSLTSVIIPDSVTSIGKGAFEWCESLESVTIPDSVTSIGDSAFYNCYSLTSVTIPKSVTSIGVGAFSGCTSLKSITIPDSVTSIGDGAFSDCHSLTSITIPDGVTSIGDWACKWCESLESITIPDSVTSIGDYAFHKCSSLTSVTIPDSVTTIGDEAFSDCNSLTSVTIPNSVTSIGDGAFKWCKSLESVTIPDSVTSIGDYAFSDCYNLKDIYYSSTEEQWNNILMGHNSWVGTDVIIHYNYYPNHTHTYGSWTTTKSATCTTEGSKTRKCSVCGKTEIQTISKTGHKYTTTVVKPTYTAKGYTLHKCTVCGNSYKDNITAKLVTPKVTGFKTAATSAQAVRLSWNKVSGATGYVVYRASAGKWVRVGVVKTNSFYEGKLKSGTSYRYAVKAYKTVNGKNYYSPSYPTLWTSTNPAKVSFKLSAGPKKATVKWSKVTGATGYKVYYKTSAKGKWIALKTTTGTSYTKTGLTKGKTYYFTVKAYRTVNGKTYNGAFVTKSVKVK